MFSNSAVEATSTSGAVQLFSVSGSQTVVLRCTGPGTAYLGGSTVTATPGDGSTEGLPLDVGETLVLQTPSTGASLYVAASRVTNVIVLK